MVCHERFSIVTRQPGHAVRQSHSISLFRRDRTVIRDCLASITPNSEIAPQSMLQTAADITFGARVGENEYFRKPTRACGVLMSPRVRRRARYAASLLCDPGEDGRTHCRARRNRRRDVELIELAG